MIKLLITPISPNEISYSFEVLRPLTKAEMTLMVKHEKIISEIITACCEKTIYADSYSILSLGGLKWMIEKTLSQKLFISYIHVDFNCQIFSKLKIFEFADEMKKEDSFDKAS